MRTRGVSFYVTIPQNADYVENKLSGYGISRWYEDGNRVIFYDPEALPLAYDGGFGELPLDEHVNFLRVITPSDFEGGSVTVNFTRDHRFKAYVDGEEREITGSPDFSDMEVEDVPAGQHEVIFRFEDNTFKYSLVLSVSLTLILALCYGAIKIRREDKTTG